VLFFHFLRALVSKTAVVVLQVKCADHERDKEQLTEQASQIAGLENAKSWLERRLNEAEVCVFVPLLFNNVS